MVKQQFHTADVLRLEVEDDPTGLVNLVQNPSGALGGWGWLTPVPLSTMRGDTGATGGLRLNYRNGASAPSYFTTEPMPVAAGQYVAARWKNTSPSPTPLYHRARFEWVKADGTSNGSSAQSPYISGGVNTVHALAPIQAPAATAFVRLRFDLYSNTSGGNPAVNDQLVFKEATVAKATTAVELQALQYIEPVPYLDITGPTIDVDLTRDELSAGILSATVRDVALDPAKAGLLRPGRRVRLMCLSESVWTPLFVGKAQNARTEYDYKSPGVPEQMRAKITLTATDYISELASTPRDEGVGTIAELPYLLEGAGVPWNINGSGDQVGTATVVSKNANASLLDQIAITRDSVLGYAWMSRGGVLNAWDAGEMSATPTGIYDDDEYSGLDLDYDTARCINTVTVKMLRFNLATGETVEVSHGPFIDAESVKLWGTRSAEFTVHGITESAANAQTHADAVLAANATPRVRINSVTMPVLTTAEVSKALHDLYDLVTVSNDDADLTQSLRITGIRHRITARKWMVTYEFANTGGVAPPQATPPVGVASGAAVVPSPIGSVTMFAGSVAPTGWLLCQGGTFSSLTYPALAAIVGDTYGTHSGTTYHLPDLRARSPVGTGGAAVGGGSIGNAYSLGQKYGHEAMQTHSHNMGTALVSGSMRVVGGVSTGAAPNHIVGYGSAGFIDLPNGSPSMPGANHYHPITDTGAGNAQNVHPVLGINFIIKAL